MKVMKRIVVNIFLIALIAIIKESACAPSPPIKHADIIEVKLHEDSYTVSYKEGSVTSSCEDMNTNDGYKQAKEKFAEDLEVLQAHYEQTFDEPAPDELKSFFDKKYLTHVSELALKVDADHMSQKILENGQTIRKAAQTIRTMYTTQTSSTMNTNTGAAIQKTSPVSFNYVSQLLRVPKLVQQKDIQILQTFLENVAINPIVVDVEEDETDEENNKDMETEEEKEEVILLLQEVLEALNHAASFYMIELNQQRLQQVCPHIRSRVKQQRKKPTVVQEKSKGTQSLATSSNAGSDIAFITDERYNEGNGYHSFQMNIFTEPKAKTITCPNFGNTLTQLETTMGKHLEVIESDFPFLQHPEWSKKNAWVPRVALTLNTLFFRKFNEKVAFLLPKYTQQLQQAQEQTLRNIPTLFSIIQSYMRLSEEKKFVNVVDLKLVQEDLQIIRQGNRIHVSYLSPMNRKVLEQALVELRDLTSDEQEELRKAISIGKEVEKLYGTFIQYYIMQQWNEHCSKSKRILLNLTTMKDGKHISCDNAKLNQKLNEIEERGTSAAKQLYDMALKYKSKNTNLLKTLKEEFHMEYKLGSETHILTELLSKVVGEKDFLEHKFQDYIHIVNQADTQIRKFLSGIMTSVKQGTLNENEKLKGNKNELRSKTSSTGETTLELLLHYEPIFNSQIYTPSHDVSTNPNYEKLLTLHDEMHKASIEYGFYKEVLNFCETKMPSVKRNLH